VGGTEAFDCVRREFEEAKEKVISSLSVRKLMPVWHQGSSFRLQSKAELLSRLANAVIKIERFYTRTAERTANVNCVKCADGFRRKRTPRSINDS
jgi:DNA integrity scanning protein DisA with diadenylate cyclase activity